MSATRHILRKQALDNTTNATVYTDVVEDRTAEVYAFHLLTSAASGLTVAVTLQSTNVPDPDLSDDDDWFTETGVTFAGATTASSYNEMVTLNTMGARLYRLKLVTSAGTGTIDVRVSTKSMRGY